MRNVFIVVVAAVAVAASVVTALPRGLSNVGVGFGGLFGDGSAGFIQAEYDFALPPYVSLGPELGLLFGDGTALNMGAEARVYFIPHYNIMPQPYAVFGGGLLIAFDRGPNDDTDVLGYLQFGAGLDLDLAEGPIVPYFSMGGLVAFGDDSDAAFKLEGGLRFDIF